MVEARSLPIVETPSYLEASHQAERASLGSQERIVFIPPFLDFRYIRAVGCAACTGGQDQEGQATLGYAPHHNPI